MKRLILFFMLFSLLFLSCSNKNKKTVTLVVKTPLFIVTPVIDDKVIDIYSFLQKVASDFEASYKKYNVHVKLVQYSNDRRIAEVVESYGTKNAPDIIFCDTASYIYLGNVVPLDDIVTEKMKDDIDEEFFRLKEIHGHLYTMPFQYMQNILCYNKKLFREADLDKFLTDEDIVQSWTVSEWEEVLSTLRKKLPKTSFPMMMYSESEEGDAHSMLLMRMFGADFFDEDGYFNLNEIKAIKAIKWLQDGVDKGFFPPHPEYLKITDCEELFCNDQLAIFLTNSALQRIFDDEQIDCGFVNFPSLDGKGLNTTTVQGFQVFDNNDSDKLKVAKDFVRFIYETKWLDYSANSIPVSKRVAEKYADKLQNVERYIKNESYAIDVRGQNAHWDEVRKIFFPKMQELLSHSKTPEQFAIETSEICNAALKKGRSDIKLHK